MKTAERLTGRPWGRGFLVGVALGYVAGLLMPHQPHQPHQEVREPAAPPAPRPREVPVEAPYEEPVRIPLHRVVA